MIADVPCEWFWRKKQTQARFIAFGGIRPTTEEAHHIGGVIQGLCSSFRVAPSAS